MGRPPAPLRTMGLVVRPSATLRDHPIRATQGLATPIPRRPIWTTTVGVVWTPPALPCPPRVHLLPSPRVPDPMAFPFTMKHRSNPRFLNHPTARTVGVKPPNSRRLVANPTTWAVHQVAILSRGLRSVPTVAYPLLGAGTRTPTAGTWVVRVGPISRECHPVRRQECPLSRWVKFRRRIWISNFLILFQCSSPFGLTKHYLWSWCCTS